MTRPLQMSPDELAYHKDLQAQLQRAQLTEVQAKATWLQAQIDFNAVQAAMNAYMAHMGRRYGLYPQDQIDAEGCFALVDPQHARDAAAAAQQQAVAEALPLDEPVDVEPAGDVSPAPQAELPVDSKPRAKRGPSPLA